MEVHHHPDLHHKRKKWKEYVLEFLMIFLAVTLGFFAETIREHISEKNREKDYISGLINNIQNDTSELKGLISRNEVQHTVSLHLFEFNDLTLVQLRNAGGYSLIKTNKVADSIALYESKNNDIKLQEKFLTDYYVQTWNSFKQILDGTVTHKFFRSYEATNKIPSDIYVLISHDKEKMSLLNNNYWSYSIVLRGYSSLLMIHLEFLNGFVQFLKRNYAVE
jgi:hypothetical protein